MPSGRDRASDWIGRVHPNWESGGHCVRTGTDRPDEWPTAERIEAVLAASQLRIASIKLPPMPVLNIKFDGTNVVLAWPTNAAGYQLENTTSLVPSTWSLVSSNPPTSGSQYQLSVPPTNAASYFRLHHP